MTNKILTVKDVSHSLKISLPTAYNLVNQSSFPKIRVGNRIKIPEDEFYRWVKNQIEKE